MTFQHKPHKCKDDRCQICNGGLFCCIKCGSAEGASTSDCPNEQIQADVLDLVYSGLLDFIWGKWITFSPRHRRVVWNLSIEKESSCGSQID